MEAFQNRLDSFKPRRVKHNSKNVTLKWPHPEHFKANPQSLAEAGFYFDPSVDDKDAVKCYMCGKMLSDWEEEDDPFDIHWAKCAKSCAWATLRCGLREDMDAEGSFDFTDKSRIPTSKAMEKARLATFTAGGWWPHDGTPNHGAASIKMARAGFVYTPQFPGDDLATCLYCQISLSGWDEDDDPMEEHRKRERKSGASCPFFASGSSKPPSRVNSKPPSKVASAKSHKPKAPSRSGTLDVDGGTDAEERQAAVMMGAKTPRKPRGTASSTAKTPRTVTRSKSKSVIAEEDEAEDFLPPKLAPKSSKSRAKLKEVYEDVEEEVVDDEEDRQPRAKQPRKSSRTRSRSKSRGPVDEENAIEPLVVPKKQKKTANGSITQTSDSESPSAAEPSRPPSSRTALKSRAKAPSPDEEVIEARTVPPRRQPSRPPVSHSRKPSRSHTKSKVVYEDTQDEDAPAPPVKKSSRTKATASASKQPIDPDEQEGKDVPISATKPKGRSRAKVKEDPEVVEPIHEEELDAPMTVDDPVNNHEPKVKATTSSKVDSDYDNPASAKTSTRGKKPPSPDPKVENEDEGRDGGQEPSSGSRASTKTPSLRPSSQNSLITSKPPQNNPNLPSRPPVSSSNCVLRSSSQVVEILTDEDEVDDPPPINAQPQPSHQAEPRSGIPPASAPKKAQKMLVEVVVPLRSAKQGQVEELDVQMTDERVDEAADMHIDSVIADRSERHPTATVVSIAHTPPCPVAQLPKQDVLPSTVNPPSPDQDAIATAPLPPLPAFHPPLSKLPFQQLDQLTEAELDMTVEEWIHYQMNIEYEKFKRDGEREINRFKERAEEVRQAIAAL